MVATVCTEMLELFVRCLIKFVTSGADPGFDRGLAAKNNDLKNFCLLSKRLDYKDVQRELRNKVQEIIRNNLIMQQEAVVDPSAPVKASQKTMAATAGCKFHESSGPSSDKFLDLLLGRD